MNLLAKKIGWLRKNWLAKSKERNLEEGRNKREGRGIWEEA